MSGARTRGLGAVVALVLLWLVGYPLLITLLEALGLPRAVTAEHFVEFLGRRDEWQAVWASLWISGASVALSALIGVPLAFVFERTEFPGRRILGQLVALPVALPPLVGVIAFLFLYGESGFVSRGLESLLGLAGPPWRLVGPAAILLVHAYSMYVYFYLFTRAALSRMDAAVGEAAAVLGAGRARILWRVTLPLLRPALAGAALLTFMTSLASFSAPYIFGGGYRVMTTQIWSSKLNGQLAMAQVESVILALLAFGGLWLMRRVDPGTTTVVGGVRGVAPARRVLRRPLARFGAAALGWGLAALLLLPHATLLLISFVPPATWTVEPWPPVLDGSNYRELFPILREGGLGHARDLLAGVWAEARDLLAHVWNALRDLRLEAAERVAAGEKWRELAAALGQLWPERLRPVFNSLWMAAAAAFGALALGLLAAQLSLSLRGRLGGFLETLLVVPWAIPGTVFAVALAATFSLHEPLAGRFVLVGTPWILPLAYLVRSLPLTGRSSLAGLRQFDPSLAEAAASLGAGRLRTLRRVTVPILRPALMAGAGLAFITALGDFVTSIVLYTFDTRPIAIEILSSLRLQDTGVAAVYGVLLMVLSAAAFAAWGRKGAL